MNKKEKTIEQNHEEALNLKKIVNLEASLKAYKDRVEVLEGNIKEYKLDIEAYKFLGEKL